MTRSRNSAREGKDWQARYEPRGNRRRGITTWVRTLHAVTCRCGDKNKGKVSSRSFGLDEFDVFDNDAFDNALTAAIDKVAVFHMNGGHPPYNDRNPKFTSCPYDRMIGHVCQHMVKGRAVMHVSNACHLLGLGLHTTHMIN